MIPHYLFGSSDSTDYDVLVLVDSIGTTEENKKICKVAEEQLASLYLGRKGVNANLGIIKDGALTQVYKGTADEVNNSVYRTYALHEQKFPLEISRELPRNFGIKAVRAMRIALSFMSRTQFRIQVKEALRDSSVVRARILEGIDLREITDLGKRATLLDFRKQLAFQMGQVVGLVDNQELYTKLEISGCYPELAPYLQRQEVSADALESFKRRWLASFDASLIPQSEEIEDQ